jgi:hypothetical protein
MDAVVVITVGSMAIGAVVWAVRQEGRINTHERELRLVRDDIRYIRARIDQVLSKSR